MLYPGLRAGPSKHGKEVRTVFREEEVRRWLRHQELMLQIEPSVSSTNTVLRDLAGKGAPAGLVLLAQEQTAGRGRLGRSFYSPAGTGLYLSLLLRPSCRAETAAMLTPCAAVAAAETVEELSGRTARIKWVNDVFVGGKKVCGILTEACVDSDSGRPRYVVIGLGVNVRAPEGGFPEDLRGIAGAAFESGENPELRARLAAGILDRLMDFAQDPADPAIREAYRSRSMVLGQKIRVLSPGRDPVPAEAVDLGEDYSLLVRLDDGSLARLHAGEVSLRL